MRARSRKRFYSSWRKRLTGMRTYQSSGLRSSSRRINHGTVKKRDMLVAKSGGLSGAIGDVLLKHEL
jgi:hypothetical protein